jgi:hypothetical protein
VAGLRTSVEKRIEGVVDTLAGGDPRLESLVTDRLEARRVLHGTELAKPFPPLRKTDRAQLASLLKREVQRALAGYDARGEARRLAGTAQRTALVAAALLFAGLAVGVGGFATGGTSAIAGGFVLGGILVAVGGAMVAMLRRREQALLRERLGPVRQRLGAAVRAVIEKEQASAAKSARATMDPFETFVRSESAKLRTRQAELSRLGADLGALRRRVEGLR